MARLIVVSNRVAVPSRDGGNLAGGLAVAVRSLLKRHEGLWFGWSGTVSRDEDIATKTMRESCTYGSVRGVRGNSHPYRDGPRLGRYAAAGIPSDDKGFVYANRR